MNVDCLDMLCHESLEMNRTKSFGYDLNKRYTQWVDKEGNNNAIGTRLYVPSPFRPLILSALPSVPPKYVPAVAITYDVPFETKISIKTTNESVGKNGILFKKFQPEKTMLKLNNQDFNNGTEVSR